MADISVTAASVVAASGAKISEGTAGATITAGQTLYKDAADSNKLKLADANASSTTATLVGIALHAASSGQPLKYIYEGELTLGASPLTQGLVYVASANAGGIAPAADLASGHYTTVVGIAKTAAILNVKLHTAGVTV